LYTLITRAADGDSAEVMTAIVEARDGADAHRWRELLAAPTTAVVTLTVTEAGYRRGQDGTLDLADPDVAADIQRLLAREDSAALTVPGRLVDGLRARREAGGRGIAVISCDNVAHNGEVTKQTLLALANAIDTTLSEWIRAKVSFISTMVDRITPGTTADDVADPLEASTGDVIADRWEVPLDRPWGKLSPEHQDTREREAPAITHAYAEPGSGPRDHDHHPRAGPGVARPGWHQPQDHSPPDRGHDRGHCAR